MPTETSSPTPSLQWSTARSFLSDFLLRRLAEPEAVGLERHELQGAVLLSDIASFTGHVERFVQQGAEGLEQVISGFNWYFGLVADAVKRHGGDVLDTTGDSFVCLWPAEDERELEEATVLAAQAGLAILGAIAAAGDSATWRTRIGIGAGPLELGIFGGVRGRWHLAPSGAAVADAVACEQAARAGSVLIAPSAAALLSARAVLRESPEGRRPRGGA